MSIRRFVITAVMIASLVAVTVPVAAQEIGVKGGMATASMTLKPEPGHDHLWEDGGIGGAWMRIPARSHLSLQIEGLFSEKGLWLVVQQGNFFTESADYRLRYIELPLLGRLDFADPASKYRLHLLAGAVPALKIGARFRNAIGDLSAGALGTRDIGDDVESLDVGLVAGAGLDAGRLLIEGRYTHGMRPVITSDPSVKNRVMAVMFGFRIK